MRKSRDRLLQQDRSEAAHGNEAAGEEKPRDAHGGNFQKGRKISITLSHRRHNADSVAKMEWGPVAGVGMD
ncbi:MAG: hypothetical protein ACRD1R_06520, partial [Acidobacteriota bacterium]